MPFCMSRLWSIELTLDSDTSKVERLGFDLTITNGEITGRVLTSQVKEMSQIKGRCDPVIPDGLPRISRMSFIFRVKKGMLERGVHLSGIAFSPPNPRKPEFIGRLRVIAIDDNVPPIIDPAAELQTITLAADPGDTGTGNGNQT